MSPSTRRAACAAALLLALAACNQRGADGLTDDEREKLNQHAAELDAQGGIEVIDASPDSLVTNEAVAAEPGTDGAAADIRNSTNRQ